MNPDIKSKPLLQWLPVKGSPLVIAGPCGAESASQVLQTAEALSQTGRVTVFRAGIWKPRTRPDTFEGVGEEGLQWLGEVRKRFKLLTTVEVATARHVELALRNEVDILWVGARTTVNPFYVQEIADALRGTNVPVMVKNPVNPDMQLWIGALERFNKSGISKLIAIHRGFTSYSATPYRNLPGWKSAIELKRLFPGLPLVCDISHIAGNRSLLLPVAQKALDLTMDGLMIESHIDPDNARSDAQQQITPRALESLLASLTVRRNTSGNALFESQLKQLRSVIDRLDHELIQVLSKRMEVVDKIGELKSEHNVTILQLQRWMEILGDRIPFGVKCNLDEEFLRRLYHLIHDESIRLQNEVMNAEGAKKQLS